ncbi:Oxysterol-binding protein-related protein 10 [Myotis brandtii]|uniref:Oxysterol-binding protein-related protein 10 n=1 Tax=Myotis brandtii TaxID=109478 RepID=S7NDG0_MYOBR|nr:Oxysterol-binding protein-related protein 10 [Myotis brandtii]
MVLPYLEGRSAGLMMLFFLCSVRVLRLAEPQFQVSISIQCNHRYFVLDFEAGLLQYFVNEQSKHQKPRGALSLSGAIVSLSDEAPHMLVVYSANGEMYKLRAADAKEKQLWVSQLRACAKYHMETNSKMSFWTKLELRGLRQATAAASAKPPRLQPSPLHEFRALGL